MTPAEWLAHAQADVERRGLRAVAPLLEVVAEAATRLRDAATSRGADRAIDDGRLAEPWAASHGHEAAPAPDPARPSHERPVAHGRDDPPAHRGSIVDAARLM
jgi:hypothetical protein